MTEHELFVRPVDTEKLTTLIRSTIKVADNESLHIRIGAQAGDNIIVNEECIYYFLEKRFITLPDVILQQGETSTPLLGSKSIDYDIDIPVRIRIQNVEGTSCPRYPSFFFPFPLTLLKRDYLLPALSLKNYMGTRYDYNPRIKNNMNGFLNDKDVLEQLGPKLPI